MSGTGPRETAEQSAVGVDESPRFVAGSRLDLTLDWWFLKGGAKEAAWRIIACVALWGFAAFVPPVAKGALAFLGVSLLLGPVIYACRNVVGGRTGQLVEAPTPEETPSSLLVPVAVSVIVASVVVGSCVYLVSDWAADRQIDEAQQVFAQETSRLEKESQAAIRGEQRERRRSRKISADLARARLSGSVALTAALVSRARDEYSAWETFLLGPVGQSWNGYEILRMVSKDIRNMVWARKRIDTAVEGQALRDEIDNWIERAQDVRAEIVKGATTVFLDRFVRRSQYR